VWKRLFGSREPDMTQRPTYGIPGVPQSMASGVVRNVNIAINVQPIRLDILVGRPTNTAFLPGNGPALSIEKLLEAALHYGQKALESYSTQRVALVLDALRVTESWEDSQSKFRSALPFMPACQEVRELNFQLNVVRPFEVVGAIRMNRLCQWQTVVFQLLAMHSSGAAPQFVNQQHALALQFDLSSEVRADVLETAVAKAMLDEIGVEQRALIAQGYGRLVL
jgi:hypothetical protein